jgi:hypothetical protein
MIAMNGFAILLQLFFINHHKILKRTELRNELNITKNDYTDTTAELEDLLTNRYAFKRMIVEGVDQRFIGEKDNGFLVDFVINLYKYNLLKTLEDPLISQMEKTEHIAEYEKMNPEKNSKYMSEIFKGIVFSDW